VPGKIHKPEKIPHAELSPGVKKRIEEKQVQERVAIGPQVVHETIRREGEEELKRSTSSLAWSGLAAGLSMGFSLVAEGLLADHLPNAAWAPLISKLGYSVGFLIVILARQQLYTETTLTVILPLLSKRSLTSATGVLRLWSVVLLANLVGTYLFALCIGRIGVFPAHTQQMLIEVSRDATEGNFGIVFVRAIFAGWLIALMVDTRAERPGYCHSWHASQIRQPQPGQSSSPRQRPALLKMVGYFSGLSSPSVTEISTSRRFSPKSYEEGQTRLPTFSMNRKSRSFTFHPSSALWIMAASR
jgi:hypothetical protein